MKKLYIFDFDGTLVNTFYDSVISYNKALKKHGLKEYEYESLETIDYADFISKMTRDEEVLQTYGQIYQNSKKENMKAYPNVGKVLKKLEENDKVLAICSNREINQLKEFTNKFFPDITFKYIIGYVPGEPFKPNPEMINKIIDNENFSKDEIVYIGDRMNDIKTAKNVDIDVIIVKWGQVDVDTYQEDYPLKFIEKAEELLD